MHMRIVLVENPLDRAMLSKSCRKRVALLLVISPLVFACAIGDVQEDPDCYDVSTIGGAGGTATVGRSHTSGGNLAICVRHRRTA